MKEGIHTMVTANKLREVRKAHGLNQSQLARLSGYCDKTIRCVEKGQRNPSGEFMLQMANLFEMPVEELFQIKE